MKPKLNCTDHSMLSWTEPAVARPLRFCLHLCALNVLQPFYMVSEACPVNTRETRSLEYPITCAFFKCHKTSSTDLVNVCRLAFDFEQFSDVIADKKNCFNTKCVSSNNTVCEAVSAWTQIKAIDCTYQHRIIIIIIINIINFVNLISL